MRIYGVNIEHESIMNASAYVNKPGKDDNGIQLTLTACPSTSGSVCSNVPYKTPHYNRHLWRLFKIKIKFHMDVISHNNIASFH